MSCSSFRAAFLGVALALGCGPSAGERSGSDPSDAGADARGDQELPHVLVAILVQPGDSIVELDLGAPGSLPLVATGKYLDGVDEDLTDRVTWTVENPAVGAMNGAVLEIPAFSAAAAEVSLIKAQLDDVTGTAQVTVVAYRQSGAQQDFFFILPYQDQAGASEKPLDFGTAIPSLDVFFLMDTTGSMLPEIKNLQQGLTSIVIPGITSAVADSQFGVGTSQDFPVSPYGSTSGKDCSAGALDEPDQPFKLFQTITGDIPAVQTAVGKYSTATAPIGCGADWPESHIEALYQVATGAGLAGPGLTQVPSSSAGVGGVGFREETMPVVVLITDALSHAPGESFVCQLPTATGPVAQPVDYTGLVGQAAATRQEAKDALGDICARVVGVATLKTNLPLSCTGEADLRDFATTTGARVPPSAWDVPSRPAGCGTSQCCTGVGGAGRPPDSDGLCPVVFRADAAGTGLGAHIVTGIHMLTRFATFDVTSERQGETDSTSGVPLQGGHTTADFLKAVTPSGFTLPPPPPALPAPTFDAERFQGVTPGTVVSFAVSAFNDFVPQTSEAQIFRAQIRVLAGGCTPLDRREVLILVPPIPLVID